MPTKTFALKSNADGHVYPERFTADEAAAAMRLDPWLAVEGFGDVTLVEAVES